MARGTSANGSRISLARELDLLGNAIEALKLATDQHARSPAADPRGFAVVVAASLVLLRDRLRLVADVADDDADPARLLCTENEALGGSDEERPGAVVPLWSTSERLRRLEHELRLTQSRLDRERAQEADGLRHFIRPQAPTTKGAR